MDFGEELLQIGRGVYMYVCVCVCVCVGRGECHCLFCSLQLKHHFLGTLSKAQIKAIPGRDCMGPKNKFSGKFKNTLLVSHSSHVHMGLLLYNNKIIIKDSTPQNCCQDEMS